MIDRLLWCWTIRWFSASPSLWTSCQPARSKPRSETSSFIELSEMDWMASCNVQDLSHVLFLSKYSGFLPQFRRLSDDRISDSKLALECEWFSYVPAVMTRGLVLDNRGQRGQASSHHLHHPPPRLRGIKLKKMGGLTPGNSWTALVSLSVTSDHSDCVEAGGGGWWRERTWLHNSSSTQKPDTHLQTRPQHL